MVAEGSRVRRMQSHGRGMVAFVAAQARYIPAWTWVAQAALVALMAVLGCSAESAGIAKVAVGVLSAACVLVGVPTVQASKVNGLNYSLDRMVSYAAGPAVADLPCALALLYAALLVVCVPLAIRAFKRHQVA